MTHNHTQYSHVQQHNVHSNKQKKIKKKGKKPQLNQGPKRKETGPQAKEETGTQMQYRDVLSSQDDTAPYSEFPSQSDKNESGEANEHFHDGDDGVDGWEEENSYMEWDDEEGREDDDDGDDGNDESRELTHEEVWDDSALIDAWNAANEEYEVSNEFADPFCTSWTTRTIYILNILENQELIVYVELGTPRQE